MSRHLPPPTCPAAVRAPWRAALLVAAVLAAPVYAQEGEASAPETEPALRVRPVGRLYYDIVQFDSDRRPFEDRDQTTSARLGLSGGYGRAWQFSLQYELSSFLNGGDGQDRASLRDAWVEYDLARDWSLRAGQFQEPFSLEELSSSRFNTFMEPALPNIFVPGYHAGIEATWRPRPLHLSAGLFGKTVGQNSSDEGHGAAARAVWARERDDRVIHVGMSLAWREPEDGTRRLRARPETDATDIRLVDSNRQLDPGPRVRSRALDQVHHTSAYGLEAAWVSGPWSLQGEYIGVHVARPDERDFAGWYVYASWFLTGESRNYVPARAVFGRVRPRGSAGAWEFALRLSAIDLDDRATVGGKQRDLTLGLNWYLLPNARVMLNYVRVRSERVDDPFAGGRRVLVTASDNPTILQLRLQVDF